MARHDPSSEARVSHIFLLFVYIYINIYINIYIYIHFVIVTMGLPEELYSAMLMVGYCARRHKIPGPLAQTMIDTARHSLDLWRQDEKAAMRFAALVLSGPTNLRTTTGHLPEPVASACWRLIGLLEYLASLCDNYGVIHK